MQLMRKKVAARCSPRPVAQKVRQKCEDRGEPSTLVVLQLPAVGFVCGRMSRGCRNQRGQILSESGAAEPGPSSGKVMAQNKRNSTARHFPCAPPSPFGRFSWGRRICGACPCAFYVPGGRVPTPVAVSGPFIVAQPPRPGAHARRRMGLALPVACQPAAAGLCRVCVFTAKSDAEESQPNPI
ncbi:unnamed protein product [Amoebophrya sp. A120]|nr:unnamed protein product [Amoebophrya sp. A120]|eukprot:GSA120T00001735001.1